MVEPGELEKKLEEKLDVEVSEEEIKKYNLYNEKNLEDVIRNHKPTPFLKKVFNYAIGFGAIATSFLLVGTIGLGAGLLGLSGEYINAKIRRRDFPSRQFRNVALMWSLISIPGSWLYNWMNATINVKTTIGMLQRAAVEIPAVHLVGGPAYHLISYPLENQKFKGLYDLDLKRVWWKNFKASMKYFIWPEMLMARFAPPYIHFPALLVSKALYTVTFGSRRVRIIDPYILDHKKIRGKSIYDWGKQFGIIPGEARKPIKVPDPEAYRKPKQNLTDKVKNKLSYYNSFNYQL